MISLRIYIIGSVGSGKTTLSRKLAHSLQISHYETDNFVWQRMPLNDIRRTDSERNNHFLQALETQDWIIEGVHIGWTDKGLEKADLILLLDRPYHLRTMRFVLRYFRQKFGVEQANYKPSLKMLRKMFGWNRYFEETLKPEFLVKLEGFPEKTVILRKQAEIEEMISQLSMDKFGRFKDLNIKI